MSAQLRKQTLISVLWVLMWALSFSVAMSLTKLLSSNIHTIVVVFIRVAVGFCFFLPFIYKAGLKGFATQRLKLHVFRVFLMCGALISTYYAYKHLPLAFATSLGFTGPLLTTTMAVIFLRERLDWRWWLLIVSGYIGVLIMVRPDIVVFDIAVAMAIIANILSSAARITIKSLVSTESSLQILVYNNFGALLFFSLLIPFFWQTPSGIDAVLLGFIAGAGTLSQYCYVKALQNGSASLVAPFEYSRLIFSVPVGFLLFAELPTVWTFLGSVVIILSNYGLTLLEMKKERSLTVVKSA